MEKGSEEKPEECSGMFMDVLLPLRSGFPGLYCLWPKIPFTSQMELNVALQDLTPEFEASEAMSGTFSASPPLLLRLGLTTHREAKVVKEVFCKE